MVPVGQGQWPHKHIQHLSPHGMTQGMQPKTECHKKYNEKKNTYVVQVYHILTGFFSTR